MPLRCHTLVPQVSQKSVQIPTCLVNCQGSLPFCQGKGFSEQGQCGKMTESYISSQEHNLHNVLLDRSCWPFHLVPIDSDLGPLNGPQGSPI
eukprot:UN4863